MYKSNFGRIQYRTGLLNGLNLSYYSVTRKFKLYSLPKSDFTSVLKVIRVYFSLLHDPLILVGLTYLLCENCSYFGFAFTLFKRKPLLYTSEATEHVHYCFSYWHLLGSKKRGYMQMRKRNRKDTANACAFQLDSVYCLVFFLTCSVPQNTR